MSMAERTGEADANMEKYSGCILYKVAASLPYPLRLEGGPYKIVGHLGEVELSVVTVRQTVYDARLLIKSGKFDFHTDRQGIIVIVRKAILLASLMRYFPKTLSSDLSCVDRMPQPGNSTLAGYLRFLLAT